MYANAYERSWRALCTPLGRPTLDAEIAPGPAQAMHGAAADQLRSLLRARFSPDEIGDAGIERIVEALVQYLREEQAILTSTTALQDAINTLLERPRPERPLGVRDFRVNSTMGAAGGVFPYLFDTLDSQLGVRVDCTASAIAIAISDLQAR
jgi:hypothetical protein